MGKNYAEAYSKALANAFGYVLYFGRLWTTDNTGKYRVVNAKTIEIPTLSVGGRVDGNRDTISGFTRNWDNEWEPKTLTNHRMWQTLVHPNDIDQTNTVASIVNITKTMNETQKFPEMDAYLVSTLYKLKNALSPITVRNPATITKNTVLYELDTMMDAMDEARIPVNGRILYVDTFTKTLIDNAREIYRMNGDTSLKNTVGRINEVEVVSVPSELMKTMYDFTEGWKPAAGAKQIKMLLVHPVCVLPIVSYTFAKLDDPTALSNGKYAYFEESFEDVFILNKRHDGIQMIVCDEELKTLNVTSTADDTTVGSSVITLSSPAGTGNKFVYKLANSYASVSYDENLSTWTDLPADGIIACGANTKITVAEVTDSENKARGRGIAVIVKKE